MAGCRVVGLTGGIGSGKSTVAEQFAAHGVPVVDADLIAHQLTAPGGVALPGLRAAFGDEVFAADGMLDRAALRRKVFGDAEQRSRLEAILHPLIEMQARQQLQACHAPYALLVVPLLLELPRFGRMVERVLVVDCPEILQRQRVQARSGLSEAEVAAIMGTQLSREGRLAGADDIIDNSADLAQLCLQVEEKHRYYLKSFSVNPSE